MGDRLMSINGTNKHDHLIGTVGDDIIDGRRGDDVIDGGAGNDTLIGGAGRDRFVLREGGGYDIVADFNPVEDRVLFDFSSYSDLIFLGFLSDGLEFDDFTGETHFTVSASDVNGDGITDTTITANEDSITLLGFAPETLSGSVLFGG